MPMITSLSKRYIANYKALVRTSLTQLKSWYLVKAYSRNFHSSSSFSFSLCKVESSKMVYACYKRLTFFVIIAVATMMVACLSLLISLASSYSSMLMLSSYQFWIEIRSSGFGCICPTFFVVISALFSFLFLVFNGTKMSLDKSDYETILWWVVSFNLLWECCSWS